MTIPVMQLQAGTILQNGKYRIIRVLGQGGFGITYFAENFAEDIDSKRYIALKEFFPKDFCWRNDNGSVRIVTNYTGSGDVVARLKGRFLKEARNIAILDHPGIVKIHDIFEEKNTAYYVMDYIDGENLNEMVKRLGSLTESKAKEYIFKVGDALDYIHSRNMTHFDVKPANIMVRRKDDQPILIDFGLSKQYNSNGDATSTLLNAHSEGYSPLELYTPGSLNEFSPKTDIYSLGATLYFLVVGNRPLGASVIVNEGLDIPSFVSTDLAQVIRAAMSIRRDNRPSSLFALNNQLSYAREDTIAIPVEPIDSRFKLVEGHTAVDMGLSVLWAAEDIGAKNEDDLGERFVWGDGDGSLTLKIRTSFLSRWFKGGPKNNNIAGNPKYDTASGLWGGGWRMPTISEVEELFEKTESFIDFGNKIRLYGPSGAGILLDSRRHWTAESPYGRMLGFSWNTNNGELELIMGQIFEDWADLYLPIRPVIERHIVE